MINSLKILKTAYAVIRAIEIMGKAVKNIPEEIRRKFRYSSEEYGRNEDKVTHAHLSVND